MSNGNRGKSPCYNTYDDKIYLYNKEEVKRSKKHFPHTTHLICYSIKTFLQKIVSQTKLNNILCTKSIKLKDFCQVFFWGKFVIAPHTKKLEQDLSCDMRNKKSGIALLPMQGFSARHSLPNGVLVVEPTKNWTKNVEFFCYIYFRHPFIHWWLVLR